MKHIFFILLVGFVTFSCNSQTKQNKNELKEFVSKEADFKIKVPCELKAADLTSKEQQSQSVKSYDYTCTAENFRIRIGSGGSTLKEKANNLQNLRYMPEDIKAIFPNVISSETKEITRNEEKGNVSD